MPFSLWFLLQADLTNAVLEITALDVSLSDGGMAMYEALHRARAAAAITMTRKGTIAAPPMDHEGHEPELVGPGMLKHTGIGIVSLLSPGTPGTMNTSVPLYIPGGRFLFFTLTLTVSPASPLLYATSPFLLSTSSQ